MFNSTEGVYEANPQITGLDFVPYLDCEWLAWRTMQELGRLHDGTDAAQLQELLVHPSNVSQLLPPEAAQSPALATNIQVTEAPRGGDSPKGAPSRCGDCGKSFGRPQDLKRHWKEVHTMSLRKCPFKPCTYEWKRSDKIKAHIIEVHGSGLCPVVFEGIRALPGKGVIEFVDAYEFGCSFKTPEPYISLPLPLLPVAPFEEFGPYRRCVLLRMDR